jgi:hypothetical protein
MIALIYFQTPWVSKPTYNVLEDKYYYYIHVANSRSHYVHPYDNVVSYNHNILGP